MADILGICGSARKNGSTAFLLQEALNTVGMDAELIFLSDFNIGFCLGCRSCMKNDGRCAKEDDTEPLLKKILSSRGIVLGSPNYYFDVSGLMKNMIDRSFCLSYRGIGEDTGLAWHGRRPLVNHVGSIIITQAGGGGEKAEETFNCLLDYSGLNSVGTLIASVGSQHARDFPEYTEDAKGLGRMMREEILRRQTGKK
jgi:multimeric flavodoxin WrbA